MLPWVGSVAMGFEQVGNEPVWVDHLAIMPTRKDVPSGIALGGQCCQWLDPVGNEPVWVDHLAILPTKKDLPSGPALFGQCFQGL